MIPCIFSRAGPGINFATSRCCLTLKQRETKSDSFNYLQPSPLAGQKMKFKIPGPKKRMDWMFFVMQKFLLSAPGCLHHSREFWDPRGVDTYSWTWVSEFTPGENLYELCWEFDLFEPKTPGRKIDPSNISCSS